MGLVANLGALHLQLGNLEVAARLCGQAIELDPYCYVGYFNRFLVYLSGEDREGALK